MNIFIGNFFKKTFFYHWLCDDKGTAFTEAVILMPVLVTMLMACYDLGQGITTNQKLIGSSQIIGDLIARDRSIDMDGLNDVITAGELSLQPYSLIPFGYDIASVQFDSKGSPVVLWRVTENMAKNDGAVASTKGLGDPGDGIMVVTTSYEFDPFFTHFVVDKIHMREVAFLKGRKSPTITCADCPT